MEKPRYWFKALKLPCALEQAVLQVRVFERQKSWTIPLYCDVNGVQAATAIDIEVENGLVIPPENPLLVALDRIRQHHDDAVIGNALLRCWGVLVPGSAADSVHSNSEGNLQIDQEASAIPHSASTDDRLMIFEISDGIQTEVEAFVRDLKLVGESKQRSREPVLIPHVWNDRGGRTSNQTRRCSAVSSSSHAELSRLSTSVQN